MTEINKRADEDKFWRHVDEILAENEQAMTRLRRPGEIGGVVTKLSWQGDDPLASPIEPVTDWPEPPDAA